MEFVCQNTRPLLRTDIQQAAESLQCEPAIIRAITVVETSGSGFLLDGRPKILFEATYFHKLTRGKYDISHPNISSPEWNRSLYGAIGEHQYERLEQAIALNRSAALESASWGLFQLMGVNFYNCGEDNIEDFVKDICQGEDEQLELFVDFLWNQNHLQYYATIKDWDHFALHYNGPGQEADYAERLEKEYQNAVEQGWNF